MLMQCGIFVKLANCSLSQTEIQSTGLHGGLWRTATFVGQTPLFFVRVGVADHYNLDLFKSQVKQYLSQTL